MSERSLDAVVSMSNVLFFMTVQILFFWFIASRQVDEVVRSKAEVLLLLRRRMEGEGMTFPVQLLDTVVLDGIGKHRSAASEERRNRNRLNLSLTLRWILPPILVVAAVLSALYVYNRRAGRSFTPAHWIGMALVILAYGTELLFFLFVVRPYIMVSDSDVFCTTTGACSREV